MLRDSRPMATVLSLVRDHMFRALTPAAGSVSPRAGPTDPTRRLENPMNSSLVSVLTVVELTKQTQIFATNLGSWLIPGMLCAAMYLAMSLPLGAVARRLEERWKAPTS